MMSEMDHGILNNLLVSQVIDRYFSLDYGPIIFTHSVLVVGFVDHECV